MHSVIWTWIHLSTMIIFNAAIYASMRFLNYSQFVSLVIIFFLVSINTIVPTLIYPNISKRLKWSSKFIYTPVVFAMVLIALFTTEG